MQLPSGGRSDSGPPFFVSGVGFTGGAGLGPGLTSRPGTVLAAWGGGAYISAGRKSREVFGAPDCGSPGEAPGRPGLVRAALRVLLSLSEVPVTDTPPPPRPPNLVSKSVPAGLLCPIRSWWEGLREFAPRFSPQAGSLEAQC